MVWFTVKLADVSVGISALHENTRKAYREYLTEEPPLFRLNVTKQALIEERESLISYMTQYTQADALSISEAALEEQWLYHQIGERIPEYGALLFHGSAVAVEGEAYIFTAPSGTGKSTHAHIWRKIFGDRAVMINDDKPLLKFADNTVMVCGSPWRGKHRIGTNAVAPLKGICLLTRDICNSIVSITGKEAFPELLKQCYRPKDFRRTAQTLTLLGQLTQNVPIYRLRCNMTPEAAKVAYTGMNGGIDI